MGTGAGSAWDSVYSQAETIVSYNGDTRVDLGDATTGDYYAAANAGSTPTVGAVPTVAFAADEIWDCTGTATAVNFAAGGAALGAALTACDTNYSLNDRNYINCWQLQ